MEYAKILYIMARELGITDNFVKKNRYFCDSNPILTNCWLLRQTWTSNNYLSCGLFTHEGEWKKKKRLVQASVRPNANSGITWWIIKKAQMDYVMGLSLSVIFWHFSLSIRHFPFPSLFFLFSSFFLSSLTPLPRIVVAKNLSIHLRETNKPINLESFNWHRVHFYCFNSLSPHSNPAISVIATVLDTPNILQWQLFSVTIRRAKLKKLLLLREVLFRRPLLILQKRKKLVFQTWRFSVKFLTNLSTKTWKNDLKTASFTLILAMW